MKRVVLAGTIVLLTAMLCACGSGGSEGTVASTSSLVEKIPDDDPTRQAYLNHTGDVNDSEVQETSDAASEVITAEMDENIMTEDDDAQLKETDSPDKTADEFTFADLCGIEFYFSSGAGAWATSLNVESDGRFSGIYRDDDMGSMGSDHPNGTAYYCEFSGKFTSPQKIDDYTYVVQIQEISYENEVDTQEIKDGVEYNYTEPYGLEDAGDFYIYLPGKSTQGFSELLRSWVRYGIDDATGTLTGYAIENISKEEAFFGGVE